MTRIEPATYLYPIQCSGVDKTRSRKGSGYQDAVSKVLVAVLLAIAFFLPKKALASEQFSATHSVFYNVQNNGEARVTHEVKITNKRNDLIVTSYSLTVNQMSIFDVKVSDKKDTLETTINTDNGTTTITSNLADFVVGTGKSNYIVISYKTKDIATKVGEIWNIAIPKIGLNDVSDEYFTKISIPDSFGPEIFSSPDPSEKNKKIGMTEYSYTTSSILNQAITASFGRFQVMNFNIRYQLDNPSILYSLQEIALPPSIPLMQEVAFKSISVQPERIKQDDDGNTIAAVRVPPKSTMNVDLAGSAKLYGRQINPSKGGSFSAIPDRLLKSYTQHRKYWDTQDPKIQEISMQLLDTDKTVSENAHEVYKYVAQTLKYDLSVSSENFITRKGSVEALSNPDKTACMEFTDLFIAITRSMGIPARELDGYAYNKNSADKTPMSIDLNGGDLLHAWAEYYDPSFGWVAVDPTWGSTSGIDYFTKLDTNHFVFVVKGLNSEIPYPAGSYRLDNNDTKLIDIAFSQTPEEELFKPHIAFFKPSPLDYLFNPSAILRKNNMYRAVNTYGEIAYEFNGTDLLPFMSIVVTTPPDNKKATYRDFNGSYRETNPTIFNNQYMSNTQNSYLLVFLGILVLGTVWYVVTLLKILKKRKKNIGGTPLQN